MMHYTHETGGSNEAFVRIQEAYEAVRKGGERRV
jgi:hypothetical protein